MFKLIINNLPDYATDYDYIVASVVDGNLWFYGAWNNANKAYEMARNIDGAVIKNPAKFA